MSCLILNLEMSLFKKRSFVDVNKKKWRGRERKRESEKTDFRSELLLTTDQNSEREGEGGRKGHTYTLPLTVTRPNQTKKKNEKTSRREDLC